MSDLAKYNGVNGGLEIRTVDDLSRVSKMLAASGYFTDARDAAQCGVKVLAGAEMGFGAFSSMTGIHLIKGKPSVGAGLMASAVKRHPNYNYRTLELSAQVCRIAFYERWDGKWEQIGVSEFTLADAKKAGTQNLDKFPKNMLFARAISNGVKWYCPDVFDTPVYTPEELGGVVDDGEYIESVVEPFAAPAALTGEDRPPQQRIAEVNRVLGLSKDTLKAIADSIEEDRQPERCRKMIDAMIYAWGADNQRPTKIVSGVLESLRRDYPNLVDEDLAAAAIAELNLQSPMPTTPTPATTVDGVSIE